MTSLLRSTSARDSPRWSKLALTAIQVAAPVSLLLALAVRRWQQIGAYPTGLDAGNWLAFGRGMFGDGKSTEGAYPPFVPLLASLARIGGEPWDGIRLLAIAALAGPAVAVFLVARPGAGSWFALAAAGIVAFARPISEAAAFGGYPQNFALALGLASIFTAVAHLRTGERIALVASSAAMAATALTHHMYFVVTLAWLAIAAAGWAIPLVRHQRDRIWARRALGIVPLVGVAAFLPSAVLIAGANYSPPLNAGGAATWDSWQYATRGQEVVWVGILVCSLAGLVLARNEDRTRTMWLTATGALVVGMAGFLLTAEGRLLALVFVGAGLGLACGLGAIGTHLTSSSLAGVPRALALGVLLLAPSADERADSDFAYYRTVEPGLEGAAKWLERNADGETAVVQASARGWPVGWWFEGLTRETRILVGSDERWLAFREERENARSAAKLFEFEIPLNELRTRAAAAGVRYLVFSTNDWTGWQEWDRQPVYSYESTTYRILDLRDNQLP